MQNRSFAIRRLKVYEQECRRGIANALDASTKRELLAMAEQFAQRIQESETEEAAGRSP